MIAFLKGRYNKDCDNDEEMNDFSLFEIDFKVVDNGQLVTTFHSYCKCVNNDGKLYDHIIEKYGIDQKLVDEAPTFPRIMYELEKLIRSYNISKIYTKDPFDAKAFRWNVRLYPGIPIKKEIITYFKQRDDYVRKEP